MYLMRKGLINHHAFGLKSLEHLVSFYRIAVMHRRDIVRRKKNNVLGFSCYLSCVEIKGCKNQKEILNPKQCGLFGGVFWEK